MYIRGEEMAETCKKTNYLKIFINTMTVIITILLIAFIIYGIKSGIFSSDKALTDYMKKVGIIAPLIFLLIQVLQVIFPVVPGGASCAAGVIAFGPVWGFIYNYIGLCIGSAAAFLISRKYGMKLIRKLFKEETVDKYLRYIHEKKFDKIFFWGIFLPGAPDDLLCYIAGVTNMKLKKFMWIIFIGKPLSLLGYSIGLGFLPFFK